MISLTIYLKDNTKQVVNPSNKVLEDEKGRKLVGEKLTRKFYEIAQTIAGKLYLNHKFTL